MHGTAIPPNVNLSQVVVMRGRIIQRVCSLPTSKLTFVQEGRRGQKPLYPRYFHSSTEHLTGLSSTCHPAVMAKALPFIPRPGRQNRRLVCQCLPGSYLPCQNHMQIHKTCHRRNEALQSLVRRWWQTTICTGSCVTRGKIPPVDVTRYHTNHTLRCRVWPAFRSPRVWQGLQRMCMLPFGIHAAEC